jgi:hypothetical protein
VLHVRNNRHRTYEDREAWLQGAIDLMRPWFVEVGAPLPERIHVSVGWSGHGARAPVAGETWKKEVSTGGVHEVFLSPVLDVLIDREARWGVLETLLHELIHVADDLQSGHRGNFQHLADELGLEAPYTSTLATPELVEVLARFPERLGPYPHRRMDLGAAVKPLLPIGGAPHGGKPKGGGCKTGVTKQGTRMLKLSAPDCGYTVRTTAKWLAEGLPSCPHGYPLLPDPPQ